MGRALKNYLKGIGSLIDLFPAPRYDEIAPTRSSADNFAKDRERIRSYFQASLNRLEHVKEKQ